jgi:DNA mismatch repair protein MutL
VRDTVASALRQNESSLWRVRENREENTSFQVAQQMPSYRPPVRHENTVQSRPATFHRDFHPAKDMPAEWPAAGQNGQEDTAPPALVEIPRAHYADTGAKKQQTIWGNGGFAGLTVIGQFHGTYIICQDGDDLILIDQHAAHERIVYERLSNNEGGIESQRLLMPETVELGFGEAEALTRLIPQLNEMGLEIEPFGGTTFVIKAIPTLLDDHDIASVVGALAEKSAETGLDGDLSKVLEDCRMLMACHNAVRANQHLAPKQISSMLNELDQCRNPSHCPHGRPTWIRWSRRDLEKAFKRIPT